MVQFRLVKIHSVLSIIQEAWNKGNMYSQTPPSRHQVLKQYQGKNKMQFFHQQNYKKYLKNENVYISLIPEN